MEKEEKEGKKEKGRRVDLDTAFGIFLTLQSFNPRPVYIIIISSYIPHIRAIHQKMENTHGLTPLYKQKVFHLINSSKVYMYTVSLENVSVRTPSRFLGHVVVYARNLAYVSWSILRRQKGKERRCVSMLESSGHPSELSVTSPR